MYSFEDTGAPPKGWPRFPNDVIAQSIPDYAAIVEAIRDALQPRFVEFEHALTGKIVAINTHDIATVWPADDGKPMCTIWLRSDTDSASGGISVKGNLTAVLAAIRGAQ